MAKQRDARGRFVGAAGVVDEGDEELAAQRDALADRVGRCGRRAATASSDRAAALVTIYADGDDGLSKVARERSDAFTAVRRDRFFEILSETSNVRLACDMVGISQHTAYRYRRRDASFAARWNKALADAIADLRMRVAAQGRFGQTTETVFAIDADGARKITTVRDIAPTALRTLMAAGGDAVASDRADSEAAEREAREIRLAAAERVILKLLKDVVPPENGDG